MYGYHSVRVQVNDTRSWCERLGPVRTLHSAVLDGEAEVFGHEGVGAVEVSDGAPAVQNAIMRASGKAELGDCGFAKFCALAVAQHLRMSLGGI